MTTNWIGQVVMLVTESGIVPAITTAHYENGEQSDVAASEADSVDLITLGSNSTRFINVERISSPAFSSRLSLTSKTYFIGEAGEASLDSAPLNQSINVQEDDYTFIESDDGKIIEGDSSSPLTFTIPNGVFSPGARIDVVQAGTGQITVEVEGGMNLQYRTDTYSPITAGQWSVLTFYCRAVNEFVLAGDLELS